MSDENSTGTSSEASDIDLLSEGANDEESTPDETSGVSGEQSEESETPGNSSEEGESDSSEGDSEDEEQEESPEEPQEELEAKDTIDRPSWKRIIEKYPDAAKDKDLREMFHREKAYSEVFPTIEDAKAAGNKAAILEQFDDAFFNARPEKIFENIEPSVLSRFARNMLPALHSLDRDIFVAATKPFIIKLLGDLKHQGQQTQNKNLVTSVENIAKQVFGSFELPEDIDPDEHPEVKRRLKEVADEREQGLNRVQAEFFTATDKSIKTQLEATLRNGLDPENKLSDWAKNTLIKQVLDETKEVLKNDEVFTDRLRRLYQMARRSGFTNEYKPRFISAYLGRAKVIALGLRAKHKAAAIPGRTKNSQNNRIENTRPAERNNSQNSNSSRRPSGKKSDMDIIMEGIRD